MDVCSRSTSENIKWRVRKDFKEGIIWGDNSCYGYKLKGRKFTMVQEEAEVVKKIFAMYIDGMGANAIAKKLDEEGIKPLEAEHWNTNTIMRMIGDRCYVGDLILQKTYRENYMTKIKRTNNGELDKYYVENDHEPIIDVETFEKAQEVKRKRYEKFKPRDTSKIRYLLSGMIVCVECGSRFGHKVTTYHNSWICQTYDRKGKEASHSRKVPEYAMDEAVEAIIGGYSNIRALDYIEVFNGNRLVFHLKDKTEKEFIWTERSRSESWSDNMKQMATERSTELDKLKKRGDDGRWLRSE